MGFILASGDEALDGDVDVPISAAEIMEGHVLVATSARNDTQMWISMFYKTIPGVHREIWKMRA